MPGIEGELLMPYGIKREVGHASLPILGREPVRMGHGDDAGGEGGERHESQSLAAPASDPKRRMGAQALARLDDPWPKCTGVGGVACPLDTHHGFVPPQLAT